MVCAFGRAEAAVAAAAAQLGADIRIGFENNLHLPDGRLAPDNAALVGAAVEALRGAGLEIGTGEALARRWGLS
jgi:3-keto-5-aminohexanoate cleavage enzyme